jgi:hypothetical protein
VKGEKRNVKGQVRLKTKMESEESQHKDGGKN